MISSYRAFSLRQFTGGLVFFLIGSFYILSLGSGFIASWNHIIYVIPVLVSPIFLGIGIWMMLKSFQTPFCKQCRTQIITKAGTYPLDNENQITNLLAETKPSYSISNIRFAKANNQEYIQVKLNYCPACVAVGEARVIKRGKKDKQLLFNKELAGPLVREIKEKLYL